VGVVCVSCCREVRAEKEKQRIIRNGRNKFNVKPKDVSLLTSKETIIHASLAAVREKIDNGSF